MKKPQALFLDVDGTIVDSVYSHIEAWSEAFNAVGFNVPKYEIHKLIGMGSDKLIFSSVGKLSEQKITEIRSIYYDSYYRKIDRIKLLPWAKQFIKKAENEDFEIVLVSSARAVEVENYLKLLKGNFKLVTSEDVKEAKPNPEIFIKALNGHYEVDSALVIGDSVWDIKAAKLANIRSLAVLTGGFCKNELKKAGAIKIFKDLKEAYDSFEEIAALVN